VESFWIFLADRGQGPAIAGWGVQYDTVVKRDGSWFLQHRDARAEAVADYIVR
jgi:hypothetical protein